MSKKAPDRISRSGRAGAAVDCFSVRLVCSKADGPEILVSGLVDDGVVGRSWCKDEFGAECTIPNNWLGQYELVAERFYGLYDLEYRGAAALCLAGR